MSTPLISIIVAVYNGAATMQQCIDSVARQTYARKELIIIDGGSSDGTAAMLAQNSHAIRYWESTPDRGIAHAWNKGLKHAEGEWVIFLGADDRLHDATVLQEMSGTLAESRAADLVYGHVVYEGGPRDRQLYRYGYRAQDLKRKMAIPHTAAFQRRSFFEEMGEFDETLGIAFDYEMLLRKRDLSVIPVDRIVSVMGGNGVSSRRVEESLREWRIAQLKHGVGSRIGIESWHVYYLLRYRCACLCDAIFRSSRAEGEVQGM